ncbi:MAG: sensor histidine kinase, partial [Bacteroides sp.]
NSFCEAIAEKIRASVKPEVIVAVNAPKLNVKIAPEALEHVLLHLLDNAARYTPEGGKIWIDFKKRGAHTHQFVVSDTGCGISEEKRDNLFKPFSEVKDLTKGDGLGLPICSLMVTKMNGTLSIDPAYTKGTRFVLELHV